MQPSTKSIAALSLLFAAAAACAQSDYPARPIRLVVTSTAGGTGDTLARVVMKIAEKEIGANIVVDNRPGATGTIAADMVAKAEPNGYTLLQTSTSIITIAAAGRKLPYDVINDFVQVTNLGTAEGYIVLVNPNVKAASIKELIALAKSGSLLYGSPGNGNPIHYMTEALNLRAGTKMTHVPYKGLAPALIALVSGEINVLLAPALATRPHIEAGRMRALASVSAKRISSMPNLPTMEEVGFKGFTLLGGWQGIFAPAKTPGVIVEKFQGAVAKAVHSKEIEAFMEKGGYIPDGRSPAEFRELVVSDFKRFSELARVAGIKE
ncbi:MAG: tripartite tricarboxylate transporter substrate binding protein [Betaproteobacteria bacterium]|nr:tripartite tricarboxylate transporter substrate binding protein [Betaproteobacteria bacterium]